MFKKHIKEDQIKNVNESKEVAAEDISVIEVNTTFDTSFYESGTDKIIVKLSCKKFKGEYTFEVIPKNKKLVINAKSDGICTSGVNICNNKGNRGIIINNMVIGSSSMELEIFLPEKLFEELHVHTSNGNIELEDNIQIDRIKIVSTNGNVELSNDVAVKSITISTSNGNVEIQNGASNVYVETSNGNIEYEAYLKEDTTINFETSNGDVEVDVDNVSSYEVKECTSCGYVEIDPPSDGAYALKGKIRTSNGDITVS